MDPSVRHLFCFRYGPSFYSLVSLVSIVSIVSTATVIVISSDIKLSDKDPHSSLNEETVMESPGYTTEQMTASNDAGLYQLLAQSIGYFLVFCIDTSPLSLSQELFYIERCSSVAVSSVAVGDSNSVAVSSVAVGNGIRSISSVKLPIIKQYCSGCS